MNRDQAIARAFLNILAQEVPGTSFVRQASCHSQALTQFYAYRNLAITAWNV